MYSTAGMAVLYILCPITFGYAIWSLFDVSTTNPGYISHGDLTKEQYTQQDPKISLGDKTIPLKYCETCHIIRPHRSFHCDICGNCVRKHGIYINIQKIKYRPSLSLCR
jgi:hypothetical protein